MSTSPQHAFSTISILIPEFDAIVVGSGFTEAYALHRLRDTLGLSVHAYDTGDAVDGDIVGIRVVAAEYDDANNRWDVEASDGTRARARFLIIGADDRSLVKMGIRGRDGVALDDKWQHGVRTYLGMAVPGFPNLFRAAPATNGAHLEFLSNCIGFMFERNLDYVEATRVAERWWTTRADEADTTECREIYDRVIANEYEGFSFDRPVAVVDYGPMLTLEILHASTASAA